MKKLNLRIRLMLSAIAIAVVVFVTAGALSWIESRENIDEFFDTYQLSLARGLSTTNWSHISENTQKISNHIIKSVHNSEEEDEAIGFAVFDNKGKRIFHDNEYGQHFSPFGKQGNFGIELVGGKKWRVLRIMSTDNNFIIAVGQELDFRNEVVEDMFEEFITPWIIGLFFMLIAMFLVLTIEFRPLSILANKLKRRDDNDLSPLDENNIPSEIRPLTGAVNHLLERVDNMLQRERSFIADAAHELRSPLTALKVQLEVAEMTADNPQSLSSSFRKLEQGIERSSRLVEQLLLLSKLENEMENKLNLEYLKWDMIIQQIIDEHIHVAQSKKIKIKTELDKDSFITKGNQFLISLMLRNLLDNALKYSPNGAEIIIKLNKQGFSICNSGVELTTEQLTKLGERFYRPSGQVEKGSGLGLSIVRKIAHLHNCQVQLSTPHNNFCVSIIPND